MLMTVVGAGASYDSVDLALHPNVDDLVGGRIDEVNMHVSSLSAAEPPRVVRGLGLRTDSTTVQPSVGPGG